MEGITPLFFFFTDEKFLLRALGRKWRDETQIQVVTLSFHISLSLRDFFIERWWWFCAFVSPGKFRRMRVRNQGRERACANRPLTNIIAKPPTNPTMFSKRLEPCFMDEENEASGD